MDISAGFPNGHPSTSPCQWTPTIIWLSDIWHWVADGSTEKLK
jgi:hypothetical protein